jgi:ferredoxin
MPVKITDFCVNCGVCEIICPYNAIYRGGSNWRKAQNRYYVFCDEELEYDEFWSRDHYYIVPYKCTECIGKYPEPICMTVCSKNCCIADEKHRENEEHLYAKKKYLETMPGYQ